MRSVALVSMHYYEPYVARAVDAAASLARGASAERLVLVANRPELVPALRAFEGTMGNLVVSVVQHDNTGFEFGAYEAGLRSLGAVVPDWVVFANDTFAVHGPFTNVHRQRLLDALGAPYDAHKGQVAGEVVTSPRSFSIEGQRTHRWLTTHVFALNRAALASLGGRLYAPEVDALIGDGGDPSSFFAPALDAALAEHLAAWLFSPRSPTTWYGAEPLTPANARRLAAKARAIVQEKFLSARLEEAAAWYFDINPIGVRERIAHRLAKRWFQLRFGSVEQIARTLRR